MQAFEYLSPSTVKDALAMLTPTWGEADVLAGGTDLLSLMKEYTHTPKRVVNIKGIKELGGISKSGAGLRIGAAVTLDELVTNSAIKEYPSLLEAAMGVSSPQIRNMGTVGGDLCQRPRCWYFRQGFGILAQDKSGNSLVPNGENRFHAVFPKAPAYYVNPSSLAPALIALGAKVQVAGPNGNREISVVELYTIPKSNSGRETTLAANEIVTGITVPSAKGVRNATYEVRQKEALDWPLATASVALKMKGSTVSSASVILGHVGPMPVQAKAAEDMLSGKSLTADLAAEAGKAAAQGAQPLSGTSYKVQLVRVAVKRALLDAMKQKA